MKKEMHDTSLFSGEGVAELYGKRGMTVLDIGGANVSGGEDGTLRPFFESRGMRYICLDIEPHPSVDVVVKPGDSFPFATGSIDLIVSTSCFEHDPCFWMTFLEMTRVVKEGGHIYVSAPQNGPYHKHPGDNWRFYGDAGQALAVWSGRPVNGVAYPASVIETFYILPKDPTRQGGFFGWIDWVTVWKRVIKADTEIVDDSKKTVIGSLEQYLQNVKQCQTAKLM